MLACAESDESNTVVAQRLNLSRHTVGTWRARFLRDRLDGLSDEPRPGRPRTISDAQVEQVVVTPLETKPANATHWSTRSLASQIGMSQSAVSRIWRAFGLKPHRVDTFKISKDPMFVDKVRDVVGLYLGPPANCCAEESTARSPHSRKTSAAGSSSGTPTPSPTSGPAPPIRSSSHSPPTANELTTQDTRPCVA
ncbi:hypothetical protein JCM33774_78170 [Actinophytocola sp. KF-1]